jgi:GT2 family glycosyltransferase
MIAYRLPKEIEATIIRGRPVITTAQGGKVAVDHKLLNLWRVAAGKTQPEILAAVSSPETNNQVINAAMGCLVQAGLLERLNLDDESNHSEIVSKKISIIIVSHNSRNWLEDCLSTIQEQNYVSFEVIIVENGPVDDSAWLRDAFPEVKYVRLKERPSFSSAINIGVQESSGEYLLFLNPDTRLKFNALAEMVSVIQDHPDCAAVAGKLRLMWTPGVINGIGNRVGSFSWGTDNGLGHLDLGQFDDWKEIPSVCFAAALISQKAWEHIGPLDEGFKMYYEDSEWSYRARLLGYKLYAAPQAVVYHAFSGFLPDQGMNTFVADKMANVVYGRLRFSLKLLNEYLYLFLFSYLIEDGLNFFRFFLTLKWRMCLGLIRGWIKFAKDSTHIYRMRTRLRERTIVSDRNLFLLQRSMPATNMWHGMPELTWDLICNEYLPLILQGRTNKMPEFATNESRPKLLIISHDLVDEKMAGPGMRYLEMSKALSEDLQVTLAIPSKTTLIVPSISLVDYEPQQSQSLKDICIDQDFILISSYLIDKHPFIWNIPAKVIVDLYDPFVLENLHYYQEESIDAQMILHEQSVELTNQLAKIGDFFICGNERQKDYWMGVLTANGRVNPLNYLDDPGLRNLIDVVGIGYPESEPTKKPILRGIDPHIPKDSRIVLWGGGVWNWLDPLTLIRAWPVVVEAHPEARLIILGTRHPNPDIPEHEMAREAQILASEIGEKDKTILFIEWLSYNNRESLLSEADVGIVLHPMHIETRYSIRTRVVDYMWAKLPIVISEGDITSTWVRENRIGKVVPPFDTGAVSAALIEILGRPKEAWSSAFASLDKNFRWSQVVSPLRNYCLSGSYAADRQLRAEGGINSKPSSPWRTKLARARFIMHSEGWRGLAHRTWRYVQWRLALPS